MKTRPFHISSNAGFSLAEMLVVLGIIALLSGIAAYGFVGLTETYRIKGATQTVESLMRNARQAAINARSDRRVVIEMWSNPLANPALGAETPARMWVESRLVDFIAWDVLAYDQYPSGNSPIELVSDVRQLPEFTRIADVSGLDGATLAAHPNLVDRNRVLLFFEFSGSGSVRCYANVRSGTQIPSLADLIRQAVPQNRSGAIFVHVAPQGILLEGISSDALEGGATNVYWSGSGGRAAYLQETALGTFRLNMGQLLSMGSGTSLPQITGNERTLTAEMREINRTIRYQVGSVHVIPLTGRTRAYDYGIGFPFSNIEIKENL